MHKSTNFTNHQTQRGPIRSGYQDKDETYQESTSLRCERYDCQPYQSQTQGGKIEGLQDQRNLHQDKPSNHAMAQRPFDVQIESEKVGRRHPDPTPVPVQRSLPTQYSP